MAQRNQVVKEHVRDGHVGIYRKGRAKDDVWFFQGFGFFVISKFIYLYQNISIV